MLDDDDRRVLDDIARVGWHLVGVPQDAEGPGFVYSVGMMETLGHPEIAMFGLDLSLMANVIHGMGREIRTGRTFSEPMLYDGLIERYACKTWPVAERFHKEYLGYAMWHRRYVGKIGTLQAIQCVWPDKQGRFPDEPDCHPRAVELQPLLR